MSDQAKQPLKTRIAHKHKLEIYWKEVEDKFLPKAGEFIVYDPEVDENGNTITMVVNGNTVPALPEGRTKPYTLSRLKVGDGRRYLKDLEFVSDDSINGIIINGTELSPDSKRKVSLPNATTDAYGVTKLSTAVNSPRTDVAATPSAVKQAYDLALIGRKYGQHCWHKKGYIYNTYKYVTSILPLASKVPVVSSTTLPNYDTIIIGTDATINDEGMWQLTNPRTIVYTIGQSSTVPVEPALKIVSDSGNDITTGAALLTHLNNAAAAGIYIVTGYNMYQNTILYAEGTNVFSSLYGSQYGTMGGIELSTQGKHVVKAKVIDKIVDTYADVDEILYSNSRDTYRDQEGDNGEGIELIYVGIPSEELPKGGAYERHAWHKEGYAYTEWGLANTPITSKKLIPLTDPAQSNLTGFMIGTGLSVNNITGELTLKSPQTYTFKWTGSNYSPPLPVTIYDSNGDEIPVGDLVSTLQKIAASDTGLYAVLGSSLELATVYFTNNRDTIADTTTSMSITAGGSTSSISVQCVGIKTYQNYTTDGNPYVEGVSAVQAVKNGATVTTYEDIDEVIYTSSRYAYEEGDNGQGLIYTYLGVPAQQCPLGDKFEQYCWRRQGYGYYHTDITETSASFSLFHTSEESSSSSFIVGTALSVGLDGEWSLAGQEKFTWVSGPSTSQSYTASAPGYTYTHVTVTNVTKGTSPLTLASVGGSGDTRTWFEIYIDDLLAANNGEIYIAIPADDLEKASIYKIKSSTARGVGYLGMNDPYNVTWRYGYFTMSFMYAYKCAKSTTSDDYMNQYVGIDELIYTRKKDAFSAGDNGNGLIYTYYGIPAEEWFTNKAASSVSSNSTKVQTGSYVGTGAYGSSNPNKIIFNFVPKLIFITGTWTSSVSGSSNSYYRATIDAYTLDGTAKQGAMRYECINGANSNTVTAYGDLYAYISGNTVYWYSTYGDSYKQLNQDNVRYNWIAIG
jgi:hypothetical protein